MPSLTRERGTRPKRQLPRRRSSVRRRSQIAKDKLSLGKNYLSNFPTILRNTKRDLTVEQLKKWFEDPIASEFSEVNPHQLHQIAPILEKGRLYLPPTMSSSADLIFLTDSLACLVEKQFKNGKQKVTAKTVTLELGKSFCSVYEPGLFVILGLTMATEDFSAGSDILGKDNPGVGEAVHCWRENSKVRNPYRLGSGCAVRSWHGGILYQTEHRTSSLGQTGPRRHEGTGVSFEKKSVPD